MLVELPALQTGNVLVGAVPAGLQRARVANVLLTASGRLRKMRVRETLMEVIISWPLSLHDYYDILSIDDN